MGKDADEIFLEIALGKRLLSVDQVRELRETGSKLRDMGLSRTAAQLAREKDFLTVDQITTVRREMIRQGVLPKLGGYELISKLGEGGMGTVYKARQLSLNRVVALKVLPPEMTRNPTYVARFRREGRVAAKISHPNAVQVFDVGEDTGRHYIVMEFIDGSDVSVEIAQGPIEEKRALGVIRGVAQALAVAHDQGIVHRDIKPGNIMLAAAGTPKLADLGIAKQIGTEGGTLTQAGAAVGTPQYMAPEQCRGQKDIDRRADVYSLGATLFHMVCGRVPFNAETPLAVMRKQADESLPDPRRLNPKLSEDTSKLIRWMMEKDRGARPQTCEEVAAAIDALVQGLKREGKPAHEPQQTVREWYFADSGTRIGPMSEEEARKRIEAGDITGNTKVWTAGMPVWAAARHTRLARHLPPDSPPVLVVEPEPAAAGPAPSLPVYRGGLRPEALGTMWLWHAILTGVGMPLCLIVIGIPAVIAGIVLAAILLHGFWSAIQDGSARTTPGKAVGFLFIPFYNYYWLFVSVRGLAMDVNQYCSRHSIKTKPVNEELALALCIVGCTTWIPYFCILSIIACLIMTIILWKSLTDATVAILNSKA